MSVLRYIVDTCFQNFLCWQSSYIFTIQNCFTAEHFISSEYSRCDLGSSCSDHARQSQDLSRIYFQGNVAKSITAVVLKFKYRFGLLIIDCFLCGFCRCLLILASRREQTFYEHLSGKLCYLTYNRNDTISHDCYICCDLEYLCHTVGNVNNTDSFSFQIFYTFEEALCLIKCKCTGRFIQNQDAGTAEQSS